MASQATKKKLAFPTAFTIFFLRLILLTAAKGLFWLVHKLIIKWLTDPRHIPPGAI